MSMIEVHELTKIFPVKKEEFLGAKQYLHAVDGVSFTLDRGTVYGLVGESGCGKSTTGRMFLNLIPPSKGTIVYNGQEITALSKKKQQALRKSMQMIFQDPYASLDPRMTVNELIAEPFRIHKLYKKRSIDNHIVKLLGLVGLAGDAREKYPHEFSGGQRQRIAIARALALNPDFVVCDEPVSALDVSVQAQIINLLKRLRKELSLTYLFIAHDLSVVKNISDKVGVMYLGRLVEEADTGELFENPLHPYTKALLSAVPKVRKQSSEKMGRIHLQGEVPSPISPPSGCTFRTRCGSANKHCAEGRPPLREIAPNHKTACVLV